MQSATIWAPAALTCQSSEDRTQTGVYLSWQVGGRLEVPRTSASAPESVERFWFLQRSLWENTTGGGPERDRESESTPEWVTEHQTEHNRTESEPTGVVTGLVRLTSCSGGGGVRSWSPGAVTPLGRSNFTACWCSFWRTRRIFPNMFPNCNQQPLGTRSVRSASVRTPGSTFVQ